MCGGRGCGLRGGGGAMVRIGQVFGMGWGVEWDFVYALRFRVVVTWLMSCLRRTS